MQRRYKFLDRLKLYWQSSGEQKVLITCTLKVLSFKSISDESLVIVNRIHFVSYPDNPHIAANII